MANQRDALAAIASGLLSQIAAGQSTLPSSTQDSTNVTPTNNASILRLQ